MRCCLYLLIFLTISSAWAQGTGHPGGGGPGDPYGNQQFCSDVDERLMDFEREFCKSWGIKYKNTLDFTKLVDDIYMVQFLDEINHIIKGKDHQLCKQEPFVDSNENLNKRRNAAKEVKNLKSYLEVSTREVRSNCPAVYTQRLPHFKNIAELIRMYER